MHTKRKHLLNFYLLLLLFITSRIQVYSDFMPGIFFMNTCFLLFAVFFILLEVNTRVNMVMEMNPARSIRCHQLFLEH